MWVNFFYDHINFEYAQPLFVSIVNVNFTTNKFIFAKGSKFNLNPHLPLQINFLKIFNAYLFVIYLYRICLIDILELTVKCYIWPTLVQTWVETIAQLVPKGALHQRKRFWKTKAFKFWTLGLIFSRVLPYWCSQNVVCRIGIMRNGINFAWMPTYK